MFKLIYKDNVKFKKNSREKKNNKNNISPTY